ncbi:MAG TPA: LemA family protein [Vicinamibacteria bacterium]|nr:LemA family protein [Vicinamibacteria bacterium]
MGKFAMVLLGVIVAVALAGGGCAVAAYNNLVGLQQGVDAAWAQVENVYQRRSDLIPNLVATVQGAAGFEQATLSAVTEARASVGRVQLSGKDLVNNPQAFAQWQAAQEGLGGALQRLLVVAESYPDLKATGAFRDLQAQLEGTENRISVERMRFNEAAQAYNTARLRFPASIVANMGGFAEKAYFKATAGAEKAPEVKFDFGKSPAPAH